MTPTEMLLTHPEYALRLEAGEPCLKAVRTPQWHPGAWCTRTGWWRLPGTSYTGTYCTQHAAGLLAYYLSQQRRPP